MSKNLTRAKASRPGGAELADELDELVGRLRSLAPSWLRPLARWRWRRAVDRIEQVGAGLKEVGFDAKHVAKILDPKGEVR